MKTTETRIKSKEAIGWITECGMVLQPHQQINSENVEAMAAAPGVRVLFDDNGPWVTLEDIQPLEKLDVSGTITDQDGNDMRVVKSLNRIASALEKLEKHLSSLVFKGYNP